MSLTYQVLEYLSKKGYSRTEAMLRKESANADHEGRPIAQRAEEAGGKMYRIAYLATSRWVDNVLDIYKPELKRLLWPLFVYSFLAMVAAYYPKESEGMLRCFQAKWQNGLSVCRLRTLTSA